MSYGHNKDTGFVVKDSGERKEYASGMRRDTQEGKPNYRLIDIPFLTRIADHLVKGAQKYGRDNWRLANSQEELDRFLDSAFRHMMQYLNGETDEDHMAAVCFNLMAAEHVKRQLEKNQKKPVDQGRFDLVLDLQKYSKMHIIQDRNSTVDFAHIHRLFQSALVDSPTIMATRRDDIITYKFIWPKFYAVHSFPIEEFEYIRDVDWLILSTASDINNMYLDKKIDDLSGAK